MNRTFNALSSHQIRSVLDCHRPLELSSDASFKRSAVAVIIHYRGGSPYILLMKRIERPGDPWSGQVSFPGGGEEDVDETLLDTARRECMEEVGIDLLRHGVHLGQLDDVQAMSGGQPVSMFIRPFVFELMTEVDTELGPEARDVRWIPLNEIAPVASEEIYAYQGRDRVIELPCWRYQGFTVWGLTRHMIHAFLCLLKAR